MAKEMLVTTTEKIPGHNYEVLGEVFGVTTQSKNVFSNIQKRFFQYRRRTEKRGWRRDQSLYQNAA